MNWSKIFETAGKIGLYICLIAVVILNVLKVFVPVINRYIGISITLSLISLALIAILAHLGKILAKKKILWHL